MILWDDGGYESACDHFRTFERTGQLSELEAAISGFRALASTRLDGAVANGLAIALWSRYEVLGDRGDLDEAVTGLRQAIGRHPDDAERLPSYLANLAGALRVRWRATGSGDDVVEAAEAGRRAVEVTPAHHRRRSARLNNHADGLLTVHLHSGDSSALDRAISLFRQAVDAADAGSDDLVNAKSNLAEALRLRFQSTRDIGLIDEAAVLAGTVVPRARTRALRARFQSNLALVLLARHSATGRDQDLRAATDLVHQALKESPAGHPNRAERSAVLAECQRLALVSSHRGARAPHRLGTDRASGLPFLLRRKGKRLARATEDAVRSTPHGHPTRADALLKHGLALAFVDDRVAALALYRQVAEEPDFPPRVRVEAARLWAYEMVARRNWPAALEAFRLAVELLPRTAPRHVTQADREQALAAFAGLASDAAACAIQAGDPSLAVALLEQGRGVMIGHALDARTEVTDLEEQHPDLARRFDELRTALDAPSGAFVQAAGLSGERRHALTEEWHDLVDSIRSLPGFARFLRPPAVEEFADSADRGLVVIVNVSALRCDALLIAGRTIEPVALPELELTDLADRAERFRLSPADEIDSVLSWLRQVIVDRLPLHDAPARLWWMPTGPLTALPLHAAGDLMDRFVSSYTPTLRSLMTVWQTAAISRPDSPLIVAVPSAPGVPDLPAAQDEADDVATRFARPHVLTADRALRRSVLKALPRHRWVHFACHARSADIGGEGRLVLWDHLEKPLSVNDIARLRLAGAEIAFLSACETSAAPPELTDESQHITGAFHMAGFQHVIGTLWRVGDRTSQLVASHYYDALAETPSPAIALHTAVLKIRATHPAARWAPFVHVGG
ncbi:CHAT domain-containing protein [Lentzea sp. NPDC034063]|uniref:CHAT domain-containing protein n=1 Tax=unclassified Lentzea TaxID=2643253 RepID=UPI0033C74F8C